MTHVSSFCPFSQMELAIADSLLINFFRSSMVDVENAHHHCCFTYELQSLTYEINGISVLLTVHYGNTPIQIYRKLHRQKTENFLTKTLIFF